MARRSGREVRCGLNGYVGMLFRMRVAWISAFLSAAGSLAGQMRNLCPHLRDKPREPAFRELRRVLVAFE